MAGVREARRLLEVPFTVTLNRPVLHGCGNNTIEAEIGGTLVRLA